ncbi:MAG: acyltransferase [Clostridia bacterium]|nr:acyltransferase [Clostridia bacterium]
MDNSAVMNKPQRNMGIELFRIVSMMLVVMLHVLGWGGVISSTDPLTVNNGIAWFFETLGYCSVDCYALISGYTNVKSNFKYRRIFYLWAEVLAITLSTTVICALFIPGITVTRDEWLTAFFPMVRREYWYFDSYLILFFFIPVLNRGIQSLTKRQHITLCASMLLLATVIERLPGTSRFNLASGFSALWLMILYFVGAYFRLYGVPKFARWYVCLFTFFVSAFLAWLSRTEILLMLADGRLPIDGFWADNEDYFISYLSPFAVIMALSLLCIFARIEIRSEITKRIIATVAKATFGVFCVHVGSMFWFHFLPGRFGHFGEFSPIKLTVAVIIADIAIFAVCTVYTIAVQHLLRFAYVHQLIDLISAAVGKIGKKSENDNIR